MGRTKIDYGIDLGTTNSAISRMENGEPKIIKTDLQKDTMPSVVAVNKKKVIQAGETAYSVLKSNKFKAMKNWTEGESNSFIEFKRTMGTDKRYPCSVMDADFSSEELSAEVLKTLKSFVPDENIRSVVVTVPAKFTINQKDATLRAAKLAGFDHCELLQEPVAASMAYGLDAKSKDGHWLVFDFGGGTFDAALLKVEEGIMKVIDTEGDNYLGGKNLDYAIVEEIIIPYFMENYSINLILEDDVKRKVLQDAMKQIAEPAKIAMSFNETTSILSDLGDIPGEDDDGEELELDITVTQEMMAKVQAPLFQKAIDICKDLLKRNHLEGNSLGALILVGGPTYSPVLRKMLEAQIAKPDVSVDPMTVVAKGAALFASTVDVSSEVKEDQRDSTKIQLEFGYEATTVEEQELVTIRLLREKTTGQLPERIFIEIARGDSAWASGKKELGEQGEVTSVMLNVGKANSFNVLLYNHKGDQLASEPSQFTIIQGSKIGSATLPYFIGIEVKSRETGKVEFRSIKGLEKNQITPATGTTNGLKTQKQIRPGSKEDFLKIPIYQGEHGAEDTQAIYQEHVYDVVISGEDLPKLLPEGSEVDLTMKVDTSERISCSVYFPVLDFTEEVVVPSNTTQKEIDAMWLEREIDKALRSIDLVRQDKAIRNHEDIDKLSEDAQGIKHQLEQGRADYDTKKNVLDNLRRCLKKLDKIQDSTEWPKTEEELKDVFYRLEKNNEKYGDRDSKVTVEQFRSLIPGLIANKNVKVSQDLIDSMRQLNYALVDEGLGAQMEVNQLNYLNDEFEILDWSNVNQARLTLDRGLELAADNPVKQELRAIVLELYKMLPRADQNLIGSGDGSELIG